ncbi:glycosyltransferase family 4 protein [Pantoea dispersa]|uniref:glycosyltransferase family 4 protein n=1 Tax=Pantoea dispersa TaxID=59814 RepID=UPI002DBAB3B6|nr:glycosyltransferase family 4 protein [Pantoea dispersa]MEB5836184.1 glycosyltransferase family 4 protein [Pantoea dispersa]
MNIKSLLSIVFRVYKTEGFNGVLSRTIRKIKQKDINGNVTSIASKISIFNKRDVIGFYDFITLEDAGTTSGNVSEKAKNVINWLIPDFGIGSGGHLNIFRFISMLESKGFTNNICLVGGHRHSCEVKAKELIDEHFFKLNAKVIFGIENLPESEFSFATGWTTAYYLRAFSRTYRKLYFVQDFEPSFYASGSEFAFAEETYKFGFTGICAGEWLAKKLKEDYGMVTHSVGFSYDRKLYFPRESEVLERPRKKIFCYFRPPTIRRGLETALIALDLVAKSRLDVDFIFAGWDMNDFKFDHEFENAGLLSLDKLPDIYSQCDVALVLSFTNLSLLPLEIMACGCVVVSNDGDNVRWLLNESNSVLTSPDPKQIANEIVNLISDEVKLAALKEQGIIFARDTDWDTEGTKMASYLKALS